MLLTLKLILSLRHPPVFIPSVVVVLMFILPRKPNKIQVKVKLLLYLTN
jgi:hypothetical protein